MEQASAGTKELFEAAPEKVEERSPLLRSTQTVVVDRPREDLPNETTKLTQKRGADEALTRHHRKRAQCRQRLGGKAPESAVGAPVLELHAQETHCNRITKSQRRRGRLQHHQEFHRHPRRQRNSGELSQRRKYESGSPENCERVRAEAGHVAATKLALEAANQCLRAGGGRRH